MNAIQFLQTTPEQLAELIQNGIKNELQTFRNDLLSKDSNEDLLTRDQTCKLLQIDSSTLWHWTNKGKVTAYGIGSRRYYKRSELMDSLIKLKK